MVISNINGCCLESTVILGSYRCTDKIFISSRSYRLSRLNNAVFRHEPTGSPVDLMKSSVLDSRLYSSDSDRLRQVKSESSCEQRLLTVDNQH